MLARDVNELRPAAEGVGFVRMGEGAVAVGAGGESGSRVEEGTRYKLVEVLGLVVDVQPVRDRLVRFFVDDGSGALASCVLWVVGGADDGSGGAVGASVSQVAADVAEAAEAARMRREVVVGRRLRVQGRLGRYAERTQLTVASLQPEPDANAETLQWLDTIRLHRLATP